MKVRFVIASLIALLLSSGCGSDNDPNASQSAILDVDELVEFQVLASLDYS